MYFVYSRPNGWTDWAEIFLWTLMGGRGVLKAKEIRFFFQNVFSTGNALQLVIIKHLHENSALDLEPLNSQYVGFLDPDPQKYADSRIRSQVA